MKPSIDYFLRAHAFDSTNPIVKFSLALGYMHYALKRQADNRHVILMQGFAFLMDYYDSRQRSHSPSKRQEAEFNVARAYHLLGLTHLAIPYYERCTSLSKMSEIQRPKGSGEDFAQEAALALRGIWAANNSVGLARSVTEDWLVV